MLLVSGGEQQAEKLKSRETKDNGWMKNDEGWMMMISSCWGVSSLWLTDGQMDICECRVSFTTENSHFSIC